MCPCAGVLHCLSVQWTVIFCRMTTQSSIMIPWSSINKPRSHAAKEKVAHRSSTASEIYWSAAQMTFPLWNRGGSGKLLALFCTGTCQNVSSCHLDCQCTMLASITRLQRSEYSLCRRTDPEIHNAFFTLCHILGAEKKWNQIFHHLPFHQEVNSTFCSYI